MKKFNSKIVFTALAVLLTASCTNVEDVYIEKPTSDVIYSETFQNGLGDFKAVNVFGDQVWTYNSSGYAIMTGYANSTNYANEDWLISPEIDLTNIASAYFSFDYVMRYSNDPANDATVWVLADHAYSPDTLPNVSQWVKLDLKPFVDPGSWTFSNSNDISLNDFVGKKIRIAFRYISSATKAGTWEIKNFTVKKGTAKVVESNDGSEEKPFTVKEAIQNQAGASAWVKGYIVGYIWSGTQNNYVFSADTCTQATNIILADTNDLSALYVSKILAVQLPAGVVRDSLNLKDHKDKFGKNVTLYGSLTKYFGIGGLKSVSYYKLEDGTSGGTKPVKAIFSETFANSKGDFTIVDVTKVSVLPNIWAHDASYKCMKATAYVNSTNTNYESESWLISPTINLSGVTNPVMVFDYVTRYFANPATDATIQVSENYQGGDPRSTTWTQIPYPFTNMSSWTFVTTNPIDLSAFANKNIRIAFKYTSTSTKAGTWEIKNLVIY
ncbi:MAG TPA: DUF6359 domain-containing protein [Paludibacteraceae bacterium]|nr:DUF6359 domain-containing protein [Paludibacteraceae bacterium]